MNGVEQKQHHILSFKSAIRNVAAFFEFRVFSILPTTSFEENEEGYRLCFSVPTSRNHVTLNAMNCSLSKVIQLVDLLNKDVTVNSKRSYRYVGKFWIHKG